MDCRQPTNALTRVLPVALALTLSMLSGWLPAQPPAGDRSANPQATDRAAAATAFAHTLRVLSYNIHHAEGVDGRLDLERIAKTILSVQPDIVALQEVDCRVKRSGEVDQAQELARLTHMQVAFGGNIDLQGGQYGNALLSRGQIVGSTNHRLPNIDQGEQRGVLEVTLKHEGQSLRVFATHFDHRRDPRERLASIERVNRLAAANADTPTLLIGDLNAEFSSEVLDRVRTQWTVANAERLPTIPVSKPERQIDFIMCAPADRWQVQQVKVLEEAIASDHRGIMAVLQVRLEAENCETCW